MVTLGIDDSRWLDFIRTCPDASPFHHPAWASLLAEAYGHFAFGLAATAADGRLTMVLPVLEVSTPLRRQKWVSLPFTDSCPPLAVAPAARHGFTEELDELRRRSGIVQVDVRAELRGVHAYHSCDHVVHVMRLPSDPDEVLGNVQHATIRRNVRKAQREGVTVRWAEDGAELHAVFYGLHVDTRRRLGVPVQPRRFFRLFWERIVQRELGFVVLAQAGGRPVAGAVFLAWNDAIVYKYGASDPAAWPLRPNDLLFATVLQWAAANGFRTFDFGRSDLHATGLRRFKGGWGAIETPLTYTVLADRPPRSRSVRLAALAEPAIRRLPAWVARAVGEMLYRYAA
jgi:CelD/BcsL family acetyltransferase involved in cellulose biosynthesis